MARKLMELGYSKAYALRGGWREWQVAKYSVEAK